MIQLNFNLIRNSMYQNYIIIDCSLYRIQSRSNSYTGYTCCDSRYSNCRYLFIKLSCSKSNNLSYTKRSNSFSRTI